MQVFVGEVEQEYPISNALLSVFLSLLCMSSQLLNYMVHAQIQLKENVFRRLSTGGFGGYLPSSTTRASQVHHQFLWAEHYSSLPLVTCVLVTKSHAVILIFSSH